MLRLFIFVLIITIVGCNKKGNSNINENMHSNSAVSSDDSVLVKDSLNKDSLTGEINPIVVASSMQGIGVVSIQFSNTGSTKILNGESKAFVTLNFNDHKISFHDKNYPFSEVSNQILEQVNSFSPRINALEYEILIFDCLQKSEQFYEVIINQKTGKEGKIALSDSNAVFLTWQELLLKSYISFDSKSNPLRTMPDDQSTVVYPFNDYFFKVIEVKENWIKVKCNKDCKKCEKGDLTGWIKWKDGNNFLVQIGLVC